PGPQTVPHRQRPDDADREGFLPRLTRRLSKQSREEARVGRRPGGQGAVNIVPARGRLRGPGPLSRVAGVSAAELVGGLAVLLAAGAAVGAGAGHLRSIVAVRSAAAEVGTALYRARMFALTQGVNVGLKYRFRGDRYEWALYADGNGNGVRSAEIARGIDRPI